MATAIGMTLMEVDEVPYIDALELADYWVEFPPPHILLRAQVGWKASRKRDLNKFEREAMTTAHVIPANALPAYVVDAMKKTAGEKMRGGK